MKNNHIVEAKLLKISYGGEAICKVSDYVIFVPNGIPEDIVKIKINHLKKNYGRGEIINIIKPSPYRINPRCVFFEKGCGGCQWLNADYSSQLIWKKQIIEESFQHIGKLKVKVSDVIGMDNPVKHRNKISLHYNNGILGLMKKKSHDVINFDLCRQVLEPNQKAYEQIKSLRTPDIIKQIHIRSNENNDTGIYLSSERYSKNIFSYANLIKKRVINLKGIGLETPDKYQNLSGENHIKQKIGEIEYRIPLNGFFQTNYSMAKKLQVIVRDLLKPRSNENILDLYCGVGFFTLDIARFARFVHGIDNNYFSIKEAMNNSKLNKITNANFIFSDVKKEITKFKPNTVNSIVMDPSRTGSEKEVLTGIIKIRPKTIIYISCAPDTLARDISVLCSSGYKIDAFNPLDMFPNTYHIETVVKLIL